MPPSLGHIAHLAVELECLFVIVSYPPTVEKLVGQKALLCTRVAFPYTMRELEIIYMDLDGAVRKERND